MDASRKDAQAVQCDTLSCIAVFELMASNHLLPKEAWGLNKALTKKVRPFALLTWLAGTCGVQGALQRHHVTKLVLSGAFHDDSLPSSSTPGWNSIRRVRLLNFSGALSSLPTALTTLEVDGTPCAREWLSMCPRTLEGLFIDETSSAQDGLHKVFHMDDSSAAQGGLINLPQELLQLSELRALKLMCPNLQTLHGIGRLKALRQLCVVCAHGHSLPVDERTSTELTVLMIIKCNITAVPSVYNECLKLRYMDLSACKRLVELPESFGDLTSLTQLHLIECDMLARLPESIGNLAALRVLSMSECAQFVALPESFCRLTALTVLDMIAFPSLAQLPCSFGMLTSLKRLRISSCRSMILPESFGELAALRELDITACRRLTLPDSVWELPAVTSLSLCGCLSLTQLPSSIGGLTQLTFLELSCCMITALPDSISQLARLTSLDLNGCRDLACLPDTIGKLAALTSMDLTSCRALTALPSSFRELTALRTLAVDGCDVDTSMLPTSVSIVREMHT